MQAPPDVTVAATSVAATFPTSSLSRSSFRRINVALLNPLRLALATRSELCSFVITFGWCGRDVRVNVSAFAGPPRADMRRMQRVRNDCRETPIARPALCTPAAPCMGPSYVPAQRPAGTRGKTFCRFQSKRSHLGGQGNRARYRRCDLCCWRRRCREEFPLYAGNSCSDLPSLRHSAFVSPRYLGRLQPSETLCSALCRPMVVGSWG
jgi:hypothetical protein